MVLTLSSPVLYGRESTTLRDIVSTARTPESFLQGDRDSVMTTGQQRNYSAFESSQRDDDDGLEPARDSSQQDDDILEPQSLSSNAEQGKQNVNMTTTGSNGAEAADSATTAKNYQPSLSSDQKEFLVKRLISTQKRDFARPFLSSADSESRDGSPERESLNLTMMLTKLLGDGYISAKAFKDDVNMIIKQFVPEKSPKNNDKDHGKQLLGHVDNFLKRLPKPPSAEDGVSSLTTGDKRKANDDIEKRVAVKKAKLPGPSDAQHREMQYAKKQVIAYREGKHSNQHKKCQNLVVKRIGRMETEKKNKRTKLAQEKRRLEAMMSMPRSSMTGNADSATVADKDKDRGPEPSHTSEIDNDLVIGDLSSPEDEHDEEQLKDSQESSNINDSETQLSRMPITLIKLKSYESNLSELSTVLPSQEQIARLDYARTTGPNFVGRTAATTRGLNFGQYWPKTNGYTSQDVLLPAADSRNSNYCSHAQLTDMTQGELIYMIGNHQIWKDLVADEFLSYSKDPLFLVVHALRRFHEKQGQVTIQFLDRREAKDKDGRPAKFYGALDLYTIFNVPQWSGWGDANNIKLHPRKFTQEYLTHGPVLTPGTKFQQARIEDLIKDGLYEIFPEFAAPEEDKRAGLYTLQVVYRKIGYPPAVPIRERVASKQQTGSDNSSNNPETVQHDFQTPNAEAPQSQSSEGAKTSKAGQRRSPIYSYENCSSQTPMTVGLLTTVRKVTLNFIQIPDMMGESNIEPPLHVFLCFLTFEKRQRNDPALTEWIQKHYNGKRSNKHSDQGTVLTRDRSTRRQRPLYRRRRPPAPRHDGRCRQFAGVHAIP